MVIKYDEVLAGCDLFIGKENRTNSSQPLPESTKNSSNRNRKRESELPISLIPEERSNGYPSRMIIFEDAAKAIKTALLTPTTYVFGSGTLNASFPGLACEIRPLSTPVS